MRELNARQLAADGAGTAVLTVRLRDSGTNGRAA
jgi:hypothetical protein